MIIILEKIDKRGKIYQWSSQLDGLVVSTKYGCLGAKMRQQTKTFPTDNDATQYWTSKFWEKLKTLDYKVTKCRFDEP